jgi:hypothetical protein
MDLPEAVPRLNRLLAFVSSVDATQGFKLAGNIRLDPKARADLAGGDSRPGRVSTHLRRETSPTSLRKAGRGRSGTAASQVF